MSKKKTLACRCIIYKLPYLFRDPLVRQYVGRKMYASYASYAHARNRFRMETHFSVRRRTRANEIVPVSSFRMRFTYAAGLAVCLVCCGRRLTRRCKIALTLTQSHSSSGPVGYPQLYRVRASEQERHHTMLCGKTCETHTARRRTEMCAICARANAPPRAATA